MPEFTEVTAENLRFVRGARGLTQEAVAEILGIPFNAISKIESGGRALADAEKKLLDLYFFGIMPMGIVRPSEDLAQTLDFTEAEWRMVGILAIRAGQTPEQWIRSQILSYLAFQDSLAASPKVVNMPRAKEETEKRSAEEASAHGKENTTDADGKTSAHGSARPPRSESQKNAG